MLGVVLLFLMILSSQTLGLSKAGFDFTLSNLALQQFFFYTGPAVGYLVGILILFFVAHFMFKEGFGRSVLFNSPGESPALPTSIFKNSFRLFFISFIIFSGLGLYSSYTHQSIVFTGVGTLQHQFSATDNLIYSALIIPAAENLGAAFLIASLVFLLLYLSKKYSWGKESFTVLSWILIPLATSVFGFLNHLLRYSSSEVALTSVVIFWFIGGLLTVISGSYIPFWCLHICNNLFFSLSTQFSNENVLLWTIGLEIVLIVLFVVFFIINKKPKEDTLSV